MSNIDDLYIPTISEVFPVTWPPQDEEEAEAHSEWLGTMNKDKKYRYDSHLAAAITDVAKYGAGSEKPITVPSGCYTKCISSQFPWSLGGPTRDERIASHRMIYEMTADERKRYDFERRRIIKAWESRNPPTEANSRKTQPTQGEGESKDPQQAEGSRTAASGGEKEDESDPESEETIRGH